MSDSTVSFIHPWREDFVCNIGSVTVGGTPRTSVDNYWDGDVPWMVSGDVHLKKIFDVVGRITELGLKSSNATMVDPPAVAIALAGQGKTRGTVALVLCKLCTNQSVALVKGDAETIDTVYFFYNLEFRYEELRSRSAGGGRAGLSKQLIEQIPVPLPALPEQAKIADILSTVDNAIQRTEALIAKQNRTRAGLMQDLLTRGIDERGNLRSEQTHAFKDSPLGRIPKEWEPAVLQNKCLRITDGVHQTVTTSLEGIPFLYVSCVRESQILWNRAARISESLYHLISKGREPIPGVVLYTVVGSYGFAALVETDAPFSFQRHVAYLRPNPEELDSVFLSAWMNSPFMRLWADQSALGNAQKTITLGELRNFPVPCPSLDEQKTLARYIREQQSAATAAENILRKFHLIKTGLMQNLLTGKKRVTALLEPAAHLTKRVS